MKNRFVVLCFLLFVLSCSKIEIQSKSRQGYNKQINHICIIVSNAPLVGSEFYSSLKPILEAKFNEKNIQSFVVIFNDRSGEGQALIHAGGDVIPVGQKSKSLPAIENASLPSLVGFTPSYILKIEQASTGRGAGTASATLHLSLSEFDGGLAVWKAELNLEWGAGSFGPGTGVPVMYSPTSSIKSDPARCADQIIQRMQADGLMGKSTTTGR